ncbi:unnamed protein product [Callosobruchus maculatus]|uniref:Uncharacterized protein n=1 Tax=Callosobruchus maculatus TaxID=64391 RepID=A0A653BED2_CALMS|nr:unnamed protein product [Callosobruchus maculatus]
MVKVSMFTITGLYERGEASAPSHRLLGDTTAVMDTDSSCKSRIESGPQLFRRLNSSSHSIDGINPALFPNGGPYPTK